MNARSFLFLLLRCMVNGSWSCCRKFSAGCHWQQWLIRRYWSSMGGSQTPLTSASSLNWTDTMWGYNRSFWKSHFSRQLVKSGHVGVFSQYVSALRPPKRRSYNSTGTSIDSDMDEDISRNSRIFQRRTSLIFDRPLGTRTSFQNRSLQDFSDRIKLPAENELELSRRREFIFHFSESEKTINPAASSDSVKSENLKEEWKQVMDEFQLFPA